jgi:hypothetical protein
VEDVVETALAARDESGAIFRTSTPATTSRTSASRAHHGLRQSEPFVRAVRERVGGFIGVRLIPFPPQVWRMDAVIEAGATISRSAISSGTPMVLPDLPG